MDQSNKIENEMKRKREKKLKNIVIESLKMMAKVL